MTTIDHEPEKRALTTEELAIEATAELPNREAMTLLGTDLLPPFIGLPVVDPDLPVLTDPPPEADPIKDVLVETDGKDPTLGPESHPHDVGSQ
jgi:hypothetical protein